MPRPRHRLTPTLQAEIVAYIRAGGYAHVAAEAAGLPRDEFERWMARGQRPGAPAAYRAFVRAIREAEAQARLNAEVHAAKNKPLDWLKAGPGKDSAASPGWANSGKAIDTATKATLQAAHSELLDLLGRCVEQLAAFPEARAALAAWLRTIGPPKQNGRR